MKKALGLCLGILFLAGALALTQSITPYFELENVGVTANPTFDAGFVVSGDWAKAWSMDLGIGYFDPNVLVLNDAFTIDFSADLYFDQTVLVDIDGVLNYGCAFYFEQAATFVWKANLGNFKPEGRSTSLTVEGYVGPLTLWGGIGFLSEEGSMVPVLGIRVENEFNL